MAASWAKSKCFILGFLFAACLGPVGALAGKTCKEFSLPEDAAEAKAFAKELADQSRPGKPLTVSTAWRTGHSEADRTGREALVRMKDLQSKMEQLETELKRAVEAIRREVKERNGAVMEAIAAMQKDVGDIKKAQDQQRSDKNNDNNNDNDDNNKTIQVPELEAERNETKARVLCSAAGRGMTFTQWGCWKAFESRSTWSEARDICASLGLELASFEKGPRTRGELIQLGRDIGLKESGSVYWISLTRQPSGEWRWPSGAQLSGVSPLWDGVEPTKGEGQDKGYFYGGKGLGVQSPRNNFYFLCAVP